MATNLLATSTSTSTDAQGNQSSVSIGAGLQLTGGVLTNLEPTGPLAYSNTTVPGGNTVANSAALTTLTSSYTIPANGLSAGQVLEVNLAGVYGTAVIAPTLQIQILIGATVVLTTGVITCVAALSGLSWSARCTLLVQSIGVSGSIDAQGRMDFATAATTALSALIGNSSAFTINTTVTEAITVTVQWGVAAVASTITMRQMFVEWLRG